MAAAGSGLPGLQQLVLGQPGRPTCASAAPAEGRPPRTHPTPPPPTHQPPVFPRRRHVSSYGSLDLDVLTALQQDFDTASSGEAAAGEGEEAEAVAGGQKRARKEAGGRPPLMLSMNYASAAQTINSLIAAECK